MIKLIKICRNYHPFTTISQIYIEIAVFTKPEM